MMKSLSRIMPNRWPQLWQRLFRTRALDPLPHTVEHQRIYILPTKRGWAFLAALLLMLIASVNYALSLGYALCFLLTGLFAATLLHTYKNLSGIVVQQMSSGDAFAGDTLAFHLNLHNPSGTDRHGINLITPHYTSTNLAVASMQSVAATLNPKAKARGYQPLGRLTLQSDWPLGLWTTWSYLHADVKGIVFPSPELDPPELPSVLSAAEGAQQAIAMQGDVSGLRDYQPGDSIGSIAWKSAARGLGLKVRTFDAEKADARTEFSLEQARVTTLEEQLSRITAWVLKAESGNADYALRLPNQVLDYSRGPEQQVKALTALALYGS